MKKVSIFIVSLAILVLASACVISDQPTSQDGEDQKQTEEKSKDLTFGDTFTFDDLEITISDQINWVKLDNQFSENNGADVIEIPVTIKNLKDQTHGLNAFYYNFYGPDGNKLDSVFSYFDNDVFSAGDIMSRSENVIFVPPIFIKKLLTQTNVCDIMISKHKQMYVLSRKRGSDIEY